MMSSGIDTRGAEQGDFVLVYDKDEDVIEKFLIFSMDKTQCKLINEDRSIVIKPFSDQFEIIGPART